MIRKLDKFYTGEILEIHKNSIFLLWDELKREYNFESVYDFIMQIFLNGDVYGYFLGDTLVGCIGVEVNKDERILEVCFLLVIPELQKKGVGKKLLCFIEENYQKEIGRIILEVLSENPAVNFYEKMGYNKIHEKENKYLMDKKLK